jgi:hypothetical protein
LIVRRLLAVALVASVTAVVPSVASAQKKTAVLKLNDGVSGLAVDSGTAAALQGLGITPLAISGARVDDDGLFAFRVTSGSLLGNQPAKGVIRHNGGLRLLQGASGIKVDLNNFRINDGDPATLTTQIGSGDRIRLAVMDFEQAEAAVTKRRLAFTDVPLALTAEAAAALNTAFSTTAFAEGLSLGTLTTVARYRVKVKPRA